MRKGKLQAVEGVFERTCSFNVEFAFKDCFVSVSFSPLEFTSLLPVPRSTQLGEHPREIEEFESEDWACLVVFCFQMCMCIGWCNSGAKSAIATPRHGEHAFVYRAVVASVCDVHKHLASTGRVEKMTERKLPRCVLAARIFPSPAIRSCSWVGGRREEGGGGGDPSHDTMLRAPCASRKRRESIAVRTERHSMIEQLGLL